LARNHWIGARPEVKLEAGSLGTARNQIMRRCLAAGLGLCLVGCRPAVKPEPVMPPPVVITPADGTTPAEMPAVPTTDPVGLQGKWTHTMPGNDGMERTVILEYVRDQDGRERFEFLKPHWSDKPVFTEQVKNGDETELRFKMVSYDDESRVTPHTLRYVLKEEDGKWVGKLFESWTETPYDVVLTRSK
jgi:hypothetical protein